MNSFLVMLRRELRSITKEKTIMFAIIIQFFIASFSSIILVGIMAFYDPSSIGRNTQIPVQVGIVGDTSSPLSGYLKESRLVVTSFQSANSAQAAFLSGHIDAIMAIPKSHDGVVDMKLFLPELDTKKTVVFMALDEPLKKYENHLREANGIELNYQDVGGEPHTSYEFLYSVIIPVLMLFPALIAGSIVIDTVSEELENKTFDTLMSAPVSLNQVLSSKIFAAVVTAAAQCLLWVGLLRLNAIFLQNLGLVLLLSVIMATTISVGTAIIALHFKDRERAQFVYAILLVVMLGGSYFLNPSPFSLLTQLAAGDPNIGAPEVALYAIPLIIISTIFFKVSKRLVSVAG